ncbi:MAG: DegT/DnrJ/EryC1/StrS family aminotransferase [Elusimicrobia bacterium]|nr:DegT/DnrJ/EryC1/StrS family aminotransferase [Elusimicrobiota bacterium]
MTTQTVPDFASFKIGFDLRDKPKVFSYWEDIFASQKWSEAKYTELFEQKWGAWNGLPSVATSSWAGGAVIALEYFKVKGRKVLVPTNTFMATALAVRKAGGEVVFGDCSREDLCLSLAAVEKAAAEHDLAAVFLVHIGGHIAFDTPKIAEFCKKKGIVLIEDCAHAHGAAWDGKRPGQWGQAGVWSFFATKSVSTGEGGMLVSSDKGLIEYAKKYRNYGKFDYVVSGLNFRMSEFTAALGVVQTDRMDEIVAWKNEVAKTHLDPKHPQRLKLPAGMSSGYYKYIVFSPLEKSTGKVYDQLCHKIMGKPGEFPNAEWVAQNHWCVPLYYNPAF